MLALGGERKLDLHASGLTAIRWRASRVLKPYLGFLATQPQPFTNTDIPFDALSDVQEGVIALKRTDPGRAAVYGARRGSSVQRWARAHAH